MYLNNPWRQSKRRWTDSRGTSENRALLAKDRAPGLVVRRVALAN